MKKLIVTLVTLSLLSTSLLVGAAERNKPANKSGKATAERTIRGIATCPKCDLKEADACGVVIQVTRKNKSGEEQKAKIYLADNEVAKAFHPQICKGAKPVVAVGTVKKEDGKLVMTASKIEVAQPKAKKGRKKAQ